MLAELSQEQLIELLLFYQVEVDERERKQADADDARLEAALERAIRRQERSGQL